MPVVVVTGLPRSGTSMMMRMLEAGGVPCIYDDTLPASEFNPNGFYETRLVGDGTDWSWLLDGHAVKLWAYLDRLPSTIDAHLILMRRNIEHSLASWATLRAAKGYPEIDNKGWCEGQLRAHRLFCAGRPHIECWYGDVLADPAWESLRVQRLLGIELDLAAMAAVPDRSLNHHG